MSVDEVILNKFIGRTPGLRLPHENGIIFAKLEGNNVGGSIKDRAVWGMLKYFEQTGRLKENTTIVSQLQVTQVLL